MVKKPWYLKTRFWVNLAAAAGIVAMYFTGMSAEQWGTISGGLIAAINVVLSAMSGEVMEDDTGDRPKE